jgi:hypothetical protein
MPNDLHKVTAKLKPMNFDYELIFQAQQDFKETELFAGQFNALVNPHQGQLYKKTGTHKITKIFVFTELIKNTNIVPNKV